DLSEAGHAPRFLDDARRIATAIAGLQALGRQDFQDAQHALKQAKVAEVDRPQTCAGDADSGPAKGSLCPGVLAFYLGALDARLGAYEDARREYAYAGGRLGTAAPFINLGELYVRLGDSGRALAEFDRAVAEDPESVAAVATRAVYERDYLRPRQAALDLQRALQMRPRNLYDRLALSRALYQRGGKGDSACGIRILANIVNSSGFVDRINVETLVQYGVWLRGAGRPADAIAALRRAIRIYPSHVGANYALGLAVEQANPGDKELAASYLRRAEYAPAYTDEDYLARANAASELIAHFDADPAAKRREYAEALGAYRDSIRVNRGAVYAYYDRALLEEPSNKPAAQKDLETAARMRPDDSMIQSKLAQFYDAAGRPARGAPFHARAKADLDGRIPAEEQAAWSSSACEYVR
ncbi:MAG TPA: tetratricopeptide repeat protein, partial [Candidatus Elarobacter sp.]|nr:tetratricopeptide repeat protein [Candidatus Elarobacter sp.]